jgi:imidazolonepropionase-like amidohydrolase
VKNHTVFDPTLAPYKPGATAPGPRSRYVALSFRKDAEKRPKPSAVELEESQAVFEEFERVVRQANHDGVTIISGTDIAAERVPGFTLHDEMAELVESGLTPLQALQAATVNAVRVLHKADDFGSVDAGKVADLVLLDADPLADIRNTQRIAAVIAAGKVFRRTDLDRLLREAEDLAERE